MKEFDERIDRERLYSIFGHYNLPDYSEQGIYDKKHFDARIKTMRE